MPSRTPTQGTTDAHPFWAPAHNYAERIEAIEAARQVARKEAQHLREILAFARKHRITGPAAQAFLARQRASWKREQARKQTQEAQAQAWPHQILCCARWQVIPYIPYRLRCCGRVLALRKDPSYAE